jgi:predicted Zn-dependent protease
MVRSRFEVLDEPDLKQYLRGLGKEVIDTAGVQFFNYHFYVIEDKEFNAFAAPSGLIFFHSGLIEKMESENELVSVLAHEIGHIAKRHISSRIKKGTQISAATMGLVLASIALGGGVASQALLAGSLAAGQSASLYYSRLDEEEADLLAYDWMKELNRNPEGQVNMLKTMRRVARYRSGMVPQYLLTHPNPEARLDYVQNLVANDKAEIEHLYKRR